jgi:hypothetical protein
MRVRYQLAGKAVETKCDMSEKKARTFYENLKSNALCEWAELVGEEDDNYMEILEDYENIKLARMIKSIIG